MQKWEYLKVYLWTIGDYVDRIAENDKTVVNVRKEKKPLSFFYDYINKLGDAGWELVSVDGDNYYFKRLKSTE